jgi:hypothetical protein
MAAAQEMIRTSNGRFAVCAKADEYTNARQKNAARRSRETLNFIVKTHPKQVRGDFLPGECESYITEFQIAVANRSQVLLCDFENPGEAGFGVRANSEFHSPRTGDILLALAVQDQTRR